jgi:dynein heavy chain
MEISRFDNVEKAASDMLHRSRLWRAIHEWKELVDNWVKSPFDMIEVSEISAKADQYTRTVLSCERNLPTSSAVNYLKKLVFDFKETMPIVEALGNKNLNREHWEEIKNILNI